MSRPDAMDLDVAALLGLDAARFAAPPAKPRAAAPRSSPSSPWLWVIVPLAAALAVGFGLSQRSEKPGQLPEQTAVRALEPELATEDAPRAMSLKIIDGPRRAPRPRPRNIPMSELGPLPEDVASSHVAELEPVADPGASSPPLSATPAPTVQPDPVEPMALFADRELAPAAPEADVRP